MSRHTPFNIETQLIRLRRVEERYKAIEAENPPVSHSPGMLRRMNLCMGFPAEGERSKDADYRPYCVSESCAVMPRVVKTEKGFCCWACQGEWDLRLFCKHPHPNGKDKYCLGHNFDKGSVSWMPIGYRCSLCAGMHHFTGRPKTIESIKSCKLSCCNTHQSNEETNATGETKKTAPNAGAEEDKE